MVAFDRTDLDFILTQILMAENGQPPVNPHLPFGLREVSGTNNSTVPGQASFGAVDQVLPRLAEPTFQTVKVNIDGTLFDPHPGQDGDWITTSYQQTAVNPAANPLVDPAGAGFVVDPAPRLISNLISDQSAENPAAVAARAAANAALGTGYQPPYNPNTPSGDDDSLFINNVTPDSGLSAPFNTWMTLFGQFFDHGLDLIAKGGSGTIFIPLQPDDPLYVAGSPTNFMVLTRAANLPGADGNSGRDRGNESLNDGVNLRLPSGSRLGWGNTDFDVNLIVSDGATDRDGQYFFDIFTSDGFVGDLPLVNFAYAPYMDVLPRKYRFRLINASMSRFIKLALADSSGRAVPFKFIANDGNFVVNPITLTELDEQGSAERYDIIVDFSSFRVGDKIRLVNTLKQTDGRKPDGALVLGQALAGDNNDPFVGAIMEFRIASSVPSIDAPGTNLTTANSCGSYDKSQVPLVLTEQIPIVTPVRKRVVEFGRSGGGDSRDPKTGQCTPDCPETASFPWSIKINDEEAHTFNANRISMLIPRPGEVEHWTYVNGGGGWDHPIHLHFEEGVTMNRGTQSIPSTEKLARKDVWRLRPGGQVQFQVQFGEYGGSYVQHCHNTVHEDFAMLMRIQLLKEGGNFAAVSPTPIPTPDGVVFGTPEILREGDPRTSSTTAAATGSASSGSGSSGSSPKS